jgi:hypothetical protein
MTPYMQTRAFNQFGIRVLASAPPQINVKRNLDAS